MRDKGAGNASGEHNPLEKGGFVRGDVPVKHGKSAELKGEMQ
jgi:hypothetical protein